MTPEEKRERRQLSHDLQRAAGKKLNRRIGLWQTPAQIKAGARVMRDRIIAAGVRDAQ